MEQLGTIANDLVHDWKYFVDGCIGGLFLELAVIGGLSTINRVPTTNRLLLVTYVAGCIIGGGLYASRFMAVTTDYAAMVAGFTFPITLGSIAGKAPAQTGHSNSAVLAERRKRARQALRQRLEDQ
jgi:hypothetical protein